VAAPECVSAPPQDRQCDQESVVEKIRNYLLYIYNKLLYINDMKARRLYNRIAVLRRDRGLSRQDLAGRIGVNHQTIGYLERAEYNPSLDLALRISEVFGLPVEMIFSPEPLRPLSEEIRARPTKEGT
jgi:putative transcriptional regulator